MVYKWIQKAHPKKGALHKDLGIPADQRLPIPLLSKVAHTAAGKKVKINKKTVVVTARIKQRANFALTMKRL